MKSNTESRRSTKSGAGRWLIAAALVSTLVLGVNVSAAADRAQDLDSDRPVQTIVQEVFSALNAMKCIPVETFLAYDKLFRDLGAFTARSRLHARYSGRVCEE